MTTVMPAEVQACIGGIPPGHRPLFERLHRLILTAHPGAQVTLSYKTPACKAGNRRLYVGAWNMERTHSSTPVRWLPVSPRWPACAVREPVTC